jgi:hypothetical protein
MDIFKKLAELDLPLGQYVLVGSGALAARGIREANDLDIAVTGQLWAKLYASGEYVEVSRYGRPFLEAEGVDIIKQLNWADYSTTAEEAIRTADSINGYPFLNINETIKFKRAMGREKDILDIKLLEEHIAKNS